MATRHIAQIEHLTEAQILAITDAPAIKHKKLTGTTHAAEGGNIGINHGLSNRNKILSITGFIDQGTVNIPLGFSRPDNTYNNSYYITPTQVQITNNAGESGNILSKPFTVLITYEE